METEFSRVARRIPMSSRQRSLIIGSLLGDGTLLRTTAGSCFRVQHGLRQSGFVEWKHEILRCYVRTGPRICGRGVYFRTISHPELSELRDQFYVECRKVVPLALLETELDGFGLAVWTMDDGAADGRQVRLNTQGFTVEEVQGLARILRVKFGIEMTLNLDKKLPRLRCRQSSMRRFIEIVRPHTLPQMLYKLSL